MIRTLLLLTLVVAATTPARAQVDPSRAWRVVETEHVRVTYPAPEDSLGARVAVVAERAWRELAARLAKPPRGRVDVVVSDDRDFANGYASVTPRPVVVAFAHPPFDDLDLATFSDWFEVLLAHEMTHVFHLEQAGGVSGVMRKVFGRVPMAWPFFPHVNSPTWTIEGLAVWHETALTGSGRLAGTTTEMAVRTAAVESELPDLGVVTGHPVAWPDGAVPYVFGGAFLDWLAGRDSVAFRGYIDAYARAAVPLRVERAAERGMGVSFEDSWDEWRAEATAAARELASTLSQRAPVTQPERLTHHGYWALWPRWSPSGAEIAYSAYDGRRDLRLVRLDATTGATARETRIPRFGSSAWRDDGGMVIGGLRWQGPYRAWDDLWVVPASGDPAPLTDGARLAQPDVGPDGRIVAIQTGPGVNRIVTLAADGSDVTAIADFDPAVTWSYPRWSPDGRRIAAARRTRAGSEIVVIDPAVEDPTAGELRILASDALLNLSPAWSPDGAWIVFSSDRSGIANLYAVEVEGEGALRQVTNVIGGAYYPDVSPDGSWIAFSGYHHDGWAIERIPFDPTSWFDPFPVRLWSESSASAAAGGVRSRSAGVPLPPAPEPVSLSPPRPYSPWPTLAPLYWVPIVEPGEEVLDQEILGPGVGAATSASDVIGRHAYGLAATVDVEHGRVQGGAAYQNARLGRPVFDLWASQTWDFAGFAVLEGPPDGAPGDTLLALERDRELNLAATFPVRRTYGLGSVTLAAGVLHERLVLLDPDGSESEAFELDDPTTILPQVFLGARISTARAFAYSVSTEQGFTASVGNEWRFDPEDQGRARRESTGRIAAYLPLGRPWGFARSVLALRASGGVVRGPGAGDGHFALGGVSGGGVDLPGIETFGSSVQFPVRGYDSGERRGRTAWSATAELRFPLALIQKGKGLWPIFLDRLSGAVFVDAGDAWDPCDPGAVTCTADLDALASAGAEAVIDFEVFFRIPVVLRLGAAQTLADPKSTTFYLLVGRSF